MGYIASKNEIEATFKKVRKFSYTEKKQPFFDERSIDTFLDAINNFKSDLSKKTGFLDSIIENIEKFTWLNDPDDEALMLINDLISISNDLYTSLIRQYTGMARFPDSKRVAEKEIDAFKAAVDDLKEVTDDLESTFFHLPEMPDFVDTTKALSLTG